MFFIGDALARNKRGFSTSLLVLSLFSRGLGGRSGLCIRNLGKMNCCVQSVLQFYYNWKVFQNYIVFLWNKV